MTSPGAGEIAGSLGSPAVQSAEVIEAASGARLPLLTDTARRLYSRSIRGLRD